MRMGAFHRKPVRRRYGRNGRSAGTRARGLASPERQWGQGGGAPATAACAGARPRRAVRLAGYGDRMTRGGVRRGLRLGAALALVALAAGCGSSGSGGSSATDNGVSSKSADEIVTTALAAAKDANSVHIKAASLGGEQLAFDLHLVR